jgi:tetratricopeptide (TPR) repeat protein
MADILKLKKKAADFEAKKQMDKALDVYRDIVQAYEDGNEDTIDIPLYNRVGDMLQKAGNLPEAVSVWEKAVDHYTEGGFFNPAIAMCNKILRASPGRTVVYYKLGKIHAEKGFKGDARQNFLEYASRQQKAGNLDDAFKALKEFAELVPDQYDVRLMLADQLVKASRKDEAIAQLQLGYTQASADGDESAAKDLAAKMKEIDPAVEPMAAGRSEESGGGGLVFLDLDDGGAPPPPKKSRPTPLSTKRASKAIEGLALLPVEPSTPPASQSAAAKAVEVEVESLVEPIVEPPTMPSKETLAATAAAQDLLIEPTDVGADAPPPPRGSLMGLEVTNLAEDMPAPAELPMLEVETSAVEQVPLLEIETTESVDLPMLDTSTPPVGAPLVDLEPTAVEDIELLDVETTESAEPAPSVDIPLIEPEPSISADTSLLDIELSVTGDIPLISEEPSFGGDLPMLEVESSLGGDLPLLSDEQTSGIEFTPMEEAAPESVDEVVVEEALPELLDDAPVSTQVSADVLRERMVAMPEDFAIRRQYAEAVLEQGDRETAMHELEAAMAGFEGQGDLDTAGSIAEEIVRLDPKSIRHHQKRVEFAFRANDRTRLAEAYVELADALLADGQALKARAVYQRVLDIKPEDLRAQAAIESIPLEEEPVAPTPPRRSTTMQPRPTTSAPVTPVIPAAKADEEEYVSLGDWLREDDEPKSTRMVVEEQEPSGDEAADFADMLRKFKQGVSDNVEEEDHEAHYDLGVAYKEMGLLDEAISEFQKALRGTAERTRTFEALGHCFVEKGQLPVAATILQRALAEPGVRDESLIGVLYLLGAIAEDQQQFADAKKHYERVFAVDIQFRDVGDRLNAVEQRLS